MFLSLEPFYGGGGGRGNHGMRRFAWEGASEGRKFACGVRVRGAKVGSMGSKKLTS
jgi:hypothetical protein